MKNSDLEIIKGLIEQEADIETLSQIKEIVNNQISKNKQLKEMISDNSIKLTDKQITCLSMNLHHFLTHLEGKKLRIYNLMSGITYYYPGTEWRNLKVYDMFKIETNELLKLKNVGTNTFNVVESELNKYGLSIHNPLLKQVKVLN